MTEKQTATVRRIIETLVNNTEATAAELSSAAKVSRPTALGVINALLDRGIVLKKGVKYGFYGSCSAVLVKVCREGGEIVGYSLGEGEQMRMWVDFSPMLSYSANVMSLAKRAEGYSDFLKNRGEVFTCFVFDENNSILQVPSFFDLSLNRDSLLAAALLQKYGAGSFIYADSKFNDMLFCKDGIAIKRIDCKARGLGEAVALLKPDAVVIGREGGFELDRLYGVKIVDAFGIDEKEALTSLLCETIK